MLIFSQYTFPSFAACIIPNTIILVPVYKLTTHACHSHGTIATSNVIFHNHRVGMTFCRISREEITFVRFPAYIDLTFDTNRVWSLHHISRVDSSVFAGELSRTAVPRGWKLLQQTVSPLGEWPGTKSDGGKISDFG